MDGQNALPVAVIGAGPIGLAAAVHLLERGLEPSSSGSHRGCPTDVPLISDLSITPVLGASEQKEESQA